MSTVVVLLHGVFLATAMDTLITVMRSPVCVTARITLLEMRVTLVQMVSMVMHCLELLTTARCVRALQ